MRPSLIFIIIFSIFSAETRAEIFVNCAQESDEGYYLSTLNDWRTRVLNAGVRRQSLEEAKALSNQVLKEGIDRLVSSIDSLTAVANATLIEIIESPNILRACAIFEGN